MGTNGVLKEKNDDPGGRVTLKRDPVAPIENLCTTVAVDVKPGASMQFDAVSSTKTAIWSAVATLALINNAMVNSSSFFMARPFRPTGRWFARTALKVSDTAPSPCPRSTVPPPEHTGRFP